MRGAVWFTFCYGLQQPAVFDYCHIHSMSLYKSSVLRSLFAAGEFSLCVKNGCPEFTTFTFIRSDYRFNYSKRQHKNIGNMRDVAE
jgi:hypothetical protein